MARNFKFLTMLMLALSLHCNTIAKEISQEEVRATSVNQEQVDCKEKNNIPSTALCTAFMPLSEISAPFTVWKNAGNESIRKTRIAIKTNMLYDALTLINYSIELPFRLWDEHFSATFDHQFPWWRWGKNNNEYAICYLQVGGEARWWFSSQHKPRTKKKLLSDCLSGHFVGIYGMTGKYDFQNHRKICYQGEFWSVGFTYGYALPISHLFNLEFAISVGYAPISYRHYIPTDDYSKLQIDRQRMGTWNYFGPTKASISLVLPIRF